MSKLTCDLERSSTRKHTRPVTFFIFINDLPTDIKKHCLMFADDTNMFGAPGDDLQIDANFAENWARRWQINFNVAGIEYCV